MKSISSKSLRGPGTDVLSLTAPTGHAVVLYGCRLRTVRVRAASQWLGHLQYRTLPEHRKTKLRMQEFERNYFSFEPSRPFETSLDAGAGADTRLTEPEPPHVHLISLFLAHAGVADIRHPLQLHTCLKACCLSQINLAGACLSQLDTGRIRREGQRSSTMRPGFGRYYPGRDRTCADGLFARDLNTGRPPISSTKDWRVFPVLAISSFAYHFPGIFAARFP